MSSQRRINASRRNGALSRGPKTAAGKARSSQNATRHALLAKRVVLSNELEENFQIVLSQHVAKFKPRDGVEYGFCEEMASCYWRGHRAMCIEKGLFDQALEHHPDGPNIKRAGQAWNDLANAPSLQTLLRYQSSLHRMYRRAMDNLLRLRELDPENEGLRNEPNPDFGQWASPPPPAPAPSETAFETAPAPSQSSPASPSGSQPPTCDAAPVASHPAVGAGRQGIPASGSPQVQPASPHIFPGSTGITACGKKQGLTNLSLTTSLQSTR